MHFKNKFKHSLCAEYIQTFSTLAIFRHFVTVPKVINTISKSFKTKVIIDGNKIKILSSYHAGKWITT